MEAPSDVMMLKLRESRRHVSTCIIAEGADIGSAVNGACEMLSDYWGMVWQPLVGFTTFDKAVSNSKSSITCLCNILFNLKPNHLGAVVYVQDCIRSKVLKVLDAQVATLKVAKSNFAKTVDLVAERNAKVVMDAHINLNTSPAEPTIFVQGFRTLKEVATLASTGKFIVTRYLRWMFHFKIGFHFSCLTIIQYFVHCRAPPLWMSFRLDRICCSCSRNRGTYQRFPSHLD